MSRQATISRYSVLLDVLKYNSYPTLEDLSDALERKDLGVSLRTLQRLLQQLKDEFKIDIVYDTYRRGYYIDRKNSTGYEKMIKLFHLNQKSELISNSFGKSSPHISFEHDGETTNLMFVPEVLKAIENKLVIKILHSRFDRKREYWIKVKPYLIKEYANRFYIVGKNGKNKIRAYGLERVKELHVESEHFERDPKFDPEAYYSNVIGVHYDGEPCTRVVLKVSPLCAEYMRTLPWHSTQQIERKDDHAIVTLYVHTNYELVSKILSQGNWMEVLEPDTLMLQIKEELKNILSKYKVRHVLA